MVERFATKKDASLIKLFSFGSFQELEYFWVRSLGLFRAKLVVVKIVMLGTRNKWYSIWSTNLRLV
jgi:hypothetical protein